MFVCCCCLPAGVTAEKKVTDVAVEIYGAMSHFISFVPGATIVSCTSHRSEGWSGLYGTSVSEDFVKSFIEQWLQAFYKH